MASGHVDGRDMDGQQVARFVQQQREPGCVAGHNEGSLARRTAQVMVKAIADTAARDIILQATGLGDYQMSVPPQGPDEWIQLSDYDFGTAEAMLKSGRYVYVIFCCQQAIEKRLKAIIAEETANIPPRTHDLLRLAEDVGLDLSAKTAELFEELNVYYLEGRYAEDVAKMMRETDKKLAQRFLGDTREAMAWLVQQKS